MLEPAPGSLHLPGSLAHLIDFLAVRTAEVQTSALHPRTATTCCPVETDGLLHLLLTPVAEVVGRPAVLFGLAVDSGLINLGEESFLHGHRSLVTTPASGLCLPTDVRTAVHRLREEGEAVAVDAVASLAERSKSLRTVASTRSVEDHETSLRIQRCTSYMITVYTVYTAVR